MMVTTTLFALSVKKYLEYIMNMCSIFVHFRYREKMAFPWAEMIDIVEKLFFDTDYSVTDAFQELRHWCNAENFVLVHSNMTLCFPSMNYLPKPLCKIVWFEYVKRDLEISIIRIYLDNTYGLASIGCPDTAFINKFSGSQLLLTFLQNTQKSFIYSLECENLLNRFNDYFDEDCRDGHESDCDSDLDYFSPYVIQYLDEDFVNIYRKLT